MNKLFKSTTLWSIEKILNQLISIDSHVNEKLKKFSGKTLAIHTTNPTFTITTFIEAEKISLSSAELEDSRIIPDVAITAELADFLFLLTDKDTPLADARIKVVGDVHLIQAIQTTIRSLDTQWADLLAPIVGDIVTNEVSQFVNDLQAWKIETDQRIKRNIPDYLIEESKLIPNPNDVKKFSENLEALRLRIDRLNAKAELLSDQIYQVNN
tara:strand:- start:2269 stop:2904 length:636 start_codon:yes stop_codon:yes gene_type:complete